MISIHRKRQESIYFRLLADILSNVTNANISEVTVTSVELTKDGSTLFVFVTFSKNAKKSFQNLANIIGFIRRKISKIAIQRKVPKIVFKHDLTYIKALKIEKIIKENQ